LRISFILPGYPWVPMGGFKVVYEYANQLIDFGHEVTVVHARQVKIGPQSPVTIYQRIKYVRKKIVGGTSAAIPSLDWQPVHSKVKLLFVPDTNSCYIPDGDAIFATAWNTVASVLQYDPSKGTKFYLIQGYEAWLAPKKLVDDTWRAPLHKVVVSRWLLDIGRNLGVSDLQYIPNAIDHRQYNLTNPPHARRRRVAMMFSHVKYKGAKDGIEAIRIAKRKYPDLEALFFGTGRSARYIPKWIPYYRNPPQEFIIREIYNQASIFLSSSWGEGFALPPAEAACCGCAVVATDSGGIRDFIQHEETGLLSPPKHPKELAENLCRLLEDDHRRITLADAVRLKLADFSWNKSARMLENFVGCVVSAERANATTLELSQDIL